MIKHRISKAEVSALAAAAIFLIMGIYLGFIKDATLLNRAGSLLIICGVLLAATRFTEILSRRVDEFLKQNEKLLLNKIIENHESFFGTIGLFITGIISRHTKSRRPALAFTTGVLGFATGFLVNQVAICASVLACGVLLGS